MANINVNYIRKMNVILGIEVQTATDRFTINLPDRFLFQGNDLASAILHILMVRELATRHPEIPYDGEEYISASRWLMSFLYPTPSFDDDDG